MGEVARWLQAKPGAAGSEGVPTFQRKVGISEYLRSKYSDSPRPSGTPLINEGGKIGSSLPVCNCAAEAAQFFLLYNRPFFLYNVIRDIMSRIFPMVVFL